MGVGQSTELCRCVKPSSVFAAENRQTLAELLGNINDTADFSERGKTDEMDPRRHERGAGVRSLSTSSADAAEVRRFTEEELASFFAPYTHLLLANHHVGDAALMTPMELQSANKKATTTATAAAATAADDHSPDETAAVPSCVPPLTVLARNRYLKALDLGFNHLTGAVVAPLVESIRGLEHLRHLSLSGNPLGAEGCRVLGEWLATDPPLESLSLFHCGLTDADVAGLLDGLRGGRNTHLRCLNLDLNFCTVVTLEALLHVVEEENKTLAVVWLEGSPHDPVTLCKVPTDLTKRIEYACTAAGRFRSGRTYYAVMDGEGDAAGRAQRSVGQQPVSSTAAAAERFALRRQVLHADFAGLAPLPPDLLERLEAALAPRHALYVAAQRQAHAEEVARRALEVIGAAHRSSGEAGDTDTDSSDVYEDGAADAGGATHSGTHFSSGGACRGGDTTEDGDAEACDAASVRTASSAGQQPTRFAPHKGARSSTLLPPLDSPERLHMVMSDALHFRALHHGSVDRVGEKVLPNGFDKVWMAPLRDSGTRSQNAIVNDAPSYLRACWCDPHDAALPYAGTLHYHCVREEAIDYGAPVQPAKDSAGATKGGAKDSAGTARKRQAKAKAAERDSLDSLGMLPTIGTRRSFLQSTAEELVSQRKSAYKGCKGTGHRCASTAVHHSASGSRAASSSKHASMASVPRAPPKSAGSGAARQAAAPCRDGTVFTNQGGVTMQLNYNPVVYFSSAYVPCADIVDDCTGY